MCHRYIVHMVILFASKCYETETETIWESRSDVTEN